MKTVLVYDPNKGDIEIAILASTSLQLRLLHQAQTYEVSMSHSFSGNIMQLLNSIRALIGNYIWTSCTISELT